MIMILQIKTLSLSAKSILERDGNSPEIRRCNCSYLCGAPIQTCNVVEENAINADIFQVLVLLSTRFGAIYM